MLVTYKQIEKKYKEMTSFDDAWGKAPTTLKRFNIMNLASLVINNAKTEEINIVELGVARGDTMKMLYDIFNTDKTNFYLYDTFSGLPELDSKDKSIFTKNKKMKGKFCFHKKEVKKIVGVHNNIHYIKGLVENTLIKTMPKHVNFAHLDCDLYSPTYYTLKHMIPIMAKPSIIVIDDYTEQEENAPFPGIKKACNEIEEEMGVKINLLCGESELTQAVLFIN